VPDLGPLTPRLVTALTLAEAAKRWQASRVDAAENTKLQHRSAVRAIPRSMRWQFYQPDRPGQPYLAPHVEDRPV